MLGTLLSMIDSIWDREILADNMLFILYLKTFRNTYQHMFYTTVLSLQFRADSISVKILNFTFRILEILHKMLITVLTQSCRLRQTDIGWQSVVHPNFKQFSGTCMNIYFISLSLQFNADSISVKILNYTIRNGEISYKMLGTLLRIDSVWDGQISADSLLFILILKPLSLWHNRRHQTTPFSKKSASSLKTTGKHFPKTIKNK